MKRVRIHASKVFRYSCCLRLKAAAGVGVYKTWEGRWGINMLGGWEAGKVGGGKGACKGGGRVWV